MELHSFLILGFILAMSRRASQLVQRTVDMGLVLHVETAFLDDPKRLKTLMINGHVSGLIYMLICIWSVFTVTYGYIIVPVFAFFLMPLSAAYIFLYIPRMYFPILSVVGYLYFIYILSRSF